MRLVKLKQLRAEADARRGMDDLRSCKIFDVPVRPLSVILTYSNDRVDQLMDCLHYLDACDGADICEAVVVRYDNSEDGHDLSGVRNLRLVTVHSRRNNPEGRFCLSHARNIGLRAATNQWTLMLDSDILVDRHTFRVLSHPAVRDENCIYRTYRMNVPSHGGRLPIGGLRESVVGVDDSFVGFFHFFNKRRVSELVGGYDESFVGWGREDCDLVMRATMARMKIVDVGGVCPVYHVVHDYSADWKTATSDGENFARQNRNMREGRVKLAGGGEVLS